MRKIQLFVTNAADVTESRLREETGAQTRLFKSTYCPPYEKFEEIKKLQLAYHRAVMSRKGEIHMAIDVTEWVDHEYEEYFLIFLKYLIDHMEMRPLMVLTSAQGDRFVELLRAIRRVTFCELCPDDVFRYCADMSDYIRRTARIGEAAAAVLAEVMLGAEEAKSYTVLDTVLEELGEQVGDRPADEEDVRRLLHREGSILAMLAEEFVQRKEERCGIRTETQQLPLSLSK